MTDKVKKKLFNHFLGNIKKFQNFSQGLTPLMRYARQSNGMEALLLLLKYGADVNAMADGRNDFRTVLHYAILSGKRKLIILKILIKNPLAPA